MLSSTISPNANPGGGGMLMTFEFDSEDGEKVYAGRPVALGRGAFGDISIVVRPGETLYGLPYHALKAARIGTVHIGPKGCEILQPGDPRFQLFDQASDERLPEAEMSRTCSMPHGHICRPLSDGSASA